MSGTKEKSGNAATAATNPEPVTALTFDAAQWDDRPIKWDMIPAELCKAYMMEFCRHTSIDQVVFWVLRAQCVDALSWGECKPPHGTAIFNDCYRNDLIKIKRFRAFTNMPVEF